MSGKKSPTLRRRPSFSPRVNYEKALRDIAKNLVRLRRPERLLRMINRFLSRELGLTQAAILLFEPERSYYTIYDSQGVQKLPHRLLRFDLKHPLIAWFRSHSRKEKELRPLHACLSRSQIRSFLANGGSSSGGALPLQLRELDQVMQDLRAEVAIPSHFKGSLVGVLLLGEKLSHRLFTQTEIHFFQTLVHDVAMAVKTTEYHERLLERNVELEVRLREIERLRNKEQETYYQIIRCLAQEVHAKDPYTFGHIRQVERLGLMTAGELGLKLDEKDKAILSAGLLLHDVGKIGIPDDILKKPGSLNEEEWKVMRSHVEKGMKILEPLSDFRKAAEIVYCHHENYDGSGYPRGLKGKEIPIEARIVSVVDAFHAIVSNRCYRAAQPVEAAFEEIARSAGTQFDPEVVAAFTRAMKKHLNPR